MTRKGILVIVLMAIVITGGYAAPPDFKISIGAGGYVAIDLGATGTLGELDDVRRIMSNNYTGGGGFLFLDGTFFELSLGLFNGDGSLRDYYENNSESNSNYVSISLIGFDIGLIAKYPFEIGSKFSLYPLLGINYRIIPAMSDEDGKMIDNVLDYSALWFRLGLGMDIFFLPASVTEKIFLRLGFIGGLRLPNKIEKDTAIYYESLGMKATAYPGFGFDIKFAIGFRF